MGGEGHQASKNSVGSRQLKIKRVTTGKIANNAVTGAKVAERTRLTGADIDVRQARHRPSATSATSAELASALSDGSETGMAPVARPGDADQGHLLRQDPQRAGQRRQGRGRCLRRQGRLAADADGALLGPQRDLPRWRRAAGLRGLRRLLRRPGTSSNYSTTVVDGTGTTGSVGESKRRSQVHLRLPPRSIDEGQGQGHETGSILAGLRGRCSSSRASPRRRGGTRLPTRSGRTDLQDEQRSVEADI